MLIDFSNQVFISKDDAQTLSNNKLVAGDVVMTRTGANAGDCALFNVKIDTIGWSHTFIIRSKVWSHGYLTAFFNSEPGRLQILRARYGAAQPEVAPYYLRNIYIPRFSKAFDSSIDAKFSAAEDRNSEVDLFARLGEEKLLAALGVVIANPPLTYTTTATKALAAQRFDAEYFSPRVAQLMERLGADGLTIGDVAPARHEAFKPADHEPGTFHYIEIGGLRADGTATSESVPTDEAASRASQKVRANDIVTSTVRPIRRLSAIISPEQDGHVCSSGFVVLRPKKIAPEVLLTYLRLPVICELMDLHTSASLYPAISERDLLKLPIPNIPEKASQEIVQAVRSAHAARENAEALLARAKLAVETAIEHGEAEGMKLLAQP